MQSNDLPIENRFGEEVLKTRRVQRLSQKDLAEGLSQRGLALDASAISRIEKGSRAIRLSEAAVIADALGFSLSDVEHPRDPLEDSARIRQTIEASLSAAFQASLQVADAFEDMIWLLEREPQVLESLVDGEGSAPGSLAEYAASIERRWRGPSNIAKSIGKDLESRELSEAVLSLIRTVTSFAVGEATNVEHPEEA